MKVYGIKNCNTVSKALKWLDDHDLKYEFHDFKKLGIAEEKLKEWSDNLGWEILLNRRGTTWRQLDPELQASIKEREDAFNLMQSKTSVIKRPVIEWNNGVTVGFDENEFFRLSK